jgi:uncharacterized membrane protein YfcA
MYSLLLACTALATAILSGVFGMAGGMVLMGVYAALLPVAAAMVLHGATQLLANGMRAAILWRDIYWRGLRFYLVGSLAAFVLLFQLRYVPHQGVVFLGLGLAPFVAALLPARLLDFERPGAAVLCGAQVVAVQLLAGAAGPLLDVAFVETRLSRTQVVATKAITQVFSHTLKLVYFIPLMTKGAPELETVLAILIATLIGTVMGTRILARLTDHTFRVWSRYIIYGIGAFYLYKACFVLL